MPWSQTRSCQLPARSFLCRFNPSKFPKPALTGSRCPRPWPRSCSFSTSRSPSVADCRSNLSVGTLLCNNPHQCETSHILSQLKSLPLITHNNGQRRNAIFVFSKAFAALADDENFLGHAVDKLFGSPTATDPFHVRALVAVVDRIPSPQNALQERHQHSMTNDAHAGRSQEPLDTGFEGIAYLADASGLFLSHWQQDQNEQPTGTPLPRSQGSLTDATSVLSVRMCLGQGNHRSNTTIQLPLADTLFINGRRCTLLESQWRRMQGADRYQQVGVQSHSRVLVELSGSQETSALTLPLVPLTPLRKVTDSMGNVLRKIETASSDVGASHELEHSIANYFAKLDIPPQTVSVWAIAVPERISHAVHAHKNSPSELLWMGATLHRVLSGGGGWGKKAGLISLDSEVGFPQNTGDNIAQFLDFAAGGESSPGRRSITQPGDYVAFYIPDPNLDRLIRNHPNDLEKKSGHISIEFGVNPNSYYATDPNYSPSLDKSDPKLDHNSVQFFDDYFGAICERGISLDREFANGLGFHHQTKIDVPFTRFTSHFSTSPERSAASVSRTALKLTETPKRQYHTAKRIHEDSQNVDSGTADISPTLFKRPRFRRGSLSALVKSDEPRVEKDTYGFRIRRVGRRDSIRRDSPLVRKVASSSRIRAQDSISRRSHPVRKIASFSRIRAHRSVAHESVLVKTHLSSGSKSQPISHKPVLERKRRIYGSSVRAIQSRPPKLRWVQTAKNRRLLTLNRHLTFKSRLRMIERTRRATGAGVAPVRIRLNYKRIESELMTDTATGQEDVRSILEQVINFDREKWATSK